MKRVKNKVVIVTGGASGIGRGTCLLLAEHGGIVIVTDTNDDAGKETVGRIIEAGGKAEYFHLDVVNENEVRDLFAKVFEEYGSIDGLVNNAGIVGAIKPTDEMSEEEWDAVMDVNTKGVFLCIKNAAPFIRRSGGGSIVNISSIWGVVGSPGVIPYHASKGAVRTMTKSAALGYVADKIRVNSVHPGIINTPILDAFTDEEVDAIVAGHPMGMGQPIDIAYGILYLLSDESRFVTGSELVIDGGYLAQ